MKVLTKYSKRLAPVGAALALVVGLATPAAAATTTYTSMSVTPADPTDGTSTTWAVAVTGGAVTNARCVELYIDSLSTFASSSPAAVVTGQPSASGGFANGTWGSNTQPGSTSKYQWSNTGAVFGSSGTLTFNVTNPTASTNGYFVKLITYANACGDTTNDAGSAGVLIDSSTLVTVSVDPTLTFSVAGNNATCNGIANTIAGNASGIAVPLGRINSSTVASGSQTVSVTSNASGGFSVSLRSPGAPNAMKIDGTHYIDDSTGNHTTAVTPLGAGTEQFGYTTSDVVGQTAFAGGKVAAVPASNEAVLSKGASVMSGSACVGYVAGASATTDAGAYSASIIYTAVPVF